ncbi:MAG: polysaccharide biosynthesis C-terminal domain-containing protein, partial [Lachnospiraceae bacterium]|nr:polysaccharide biosynthesis C-terminal domain-containing protein [Lachnospiraceae bacterium]
SIYFLSVFIVVIVEQIYLILEDILIAEFDSAAALEVYSVGMSFHKYFMKFSTTISKVMAPRFFLRIDSGADKNKVTEMLIKVSRIQAIPILLVLSGLIVYGKEFIHLWVGESYDAAYYIMLVTLIPYSFELVGNLRNVILQARGLYMKRSILYLITSLINVVLTIWWLKVFGIVGAAAATGFGVMLGYIGVTVILKRDGIVDNRRYLKETYLRYVLPFIISIAFGMVLKYVIGCNTWFTFVVNVLAYTIVYAVLAFLIGLKKEEKQYFM